MHSSATAENNRVQQPCRQQQKHQQSARAARKRERERERERKREGGREEALSFTDTHHIFPYPRSLCFSFMDLTDENTRDRTPPGKMAFSAVYQLTAAIYQETHDGHD
jgi:hypothetical protein